MWKRTLRQSAIAYPKIRLPRSIYSSPTDAMLFLLSRTKCARINQKTPNQPITEG
ncbi:MAG: hypothetical protein HC903_06405 [Methylacidiphilales bacterium]|nr:hypothetical protein [Candidatus Methylacidiphilales bacterium]NJR18042.1 hypothetical protein [Calothrix sp. CSU_2_0]